MSLDTKSIENQIMHYSLKNISFSFPPTEFGKGVSRGISAYGELREENPYSIPTEEQFTDLFVQKTLPLFEVSKVGMDYQRYKVGLQARAKRAYKSMVREEHCIKRMEELYEPYGFSVLYDDETDWRKGVDATVQDHETGLEFYVHIFIDTKKSRQHRESKATRGKGRDFTGHLDLPLDMGNAKKCGDFLLYPDPQLMKFMYAMRSEHRDKGTKIG
ncbi:hypothetical protein LC065_20215 (plasmid) [Halobacillus litoralis]|uniref:hypothetical protein n=1 Tax=Halobacillus litoralis TaxID=45668 RepID=UPI001CFF1504|nr:hypothetical protein [Halobacillus litoralis]WLR49571.1 hypothetical protein LC065_20215 [Halobacillus litoralis]